MPNSDSIRPFELNVGEAFDEAANRTFSQVFQEIQVIDQYSREDTFPLIIDIRIEEFRLALEYKSYDLIYAPLLDFQGLLKARLRLIRPGKIPWEKIYEVPIPTDLLVVNTLTEKTVGKRVGEALAFLFEKIAREMGEEAREPVQRWLTQ